MTGLPFWQFVAIGVQAAHERRQPSGERHCSNFGERPSQPVRKRKRKLRPIERYWGRMDHRDRAPSLGNLPSVYLPSVFTSLSVETAAVAVLFRPAPSKGSRPGALCALRASWDSTAGSFRAPQPDAGRASAGLPTRNRPSSTAAPKSTRVSGGVSPNGRSPLGFELRFFQRTDATSLPSGSTWPCFPDRARVWPSACSRRRVSEIRQGGFIGRFPQVSRSKGLEPIELLREMRLDGLSSVGKRFRGAQKQEACLFLDG